MASREIARTVGEEGDDGAVASDALDLAVELFEVEPVGRRTGGDEIDRGGGQGGAADAITPPADAERMASLLPNARLVRIADAAHLANVEKAGEVNAAIEEWLGQLS